MAIKVAGGFNSGIKGLISKTCWAHKKWNKIASDISFSQQHDTTQTQPQQISNTQRTENKTTNVVIQQHSRKLLMMDILMSETCWAHKKWNKISSDIKLVFHSSTITMMHGPINVKCYTYFKYSIYLVQTAVYCHTAHHTELITICSCTQQLTHNKNLKKKFAVSKYAL